MQNLLGVICLHVSAWQKQCKISKVYAILYRLSWYGDYMSIGTEQKLCAYFYGSFLNVFPSKT